MLKASLVSTNKSWLIKKNNKKEMVLNILIAEDNKFTAVQYKKYLG